MIKLENTEVLGWEAAIRGMRNPMNSWEKSDSYHFRGFYAEEDHYKIGPNDHKLMMRLAKAGSVDAKYRRMIVVTVDITAPLYWWKEFDTYKVGTVANSCSTMHKIHSKEFTLEDFSCEYLTYLSTSNLKQTINDLNLYRDIFNNYENMEEGKIVALGIRSKKDAWWQMIQLLPSSYNQRRTVMLNYEVLAGIYPKRKDHKLDEWHNFCNWIKNLPYSEIITLEEA